MTSGQDPVAGWGYLPSVLTSGFLLAARWLTSAM
jgi:hypothetical protein